VLVLEEGAVFDGQCKTDPSTRPPATAGGHSLGVPPDHRGVVLSERSESKDGASGAPGLPGGAPPARGGKS